MSDCEADHGPARPAEFAVSLLASDSASNLALMCQPCTVEWLTSVAAGESWEIRRA